MRLAGTSPERAHALRCTWLPRRGRGRTGRTFVSCKEAKTDPLAQDTRSAAKLWDESEKLVACAGWTRSAHGGSVRRRKPGSTPLVSRAEACGSTRRRSTDPRREWRADRLEHRSRRREVAEAYARELERVSYVIRRSRPRAACSWSSGSRSKWLPRGLSRIAFTSGGSGVGRRGAAHHARALRREGDAEAPDRRDRPRALVPRHTLATLASADTTSAAPASEPWLADLPKAPGRVLLRCPLGKTYPGCDVACADEVEAAILPSGARDGCGGDREPIGGSTAGALDAARRVLPKLAEICRRHGVL